MHSHRQGTDGSAGGPPCIVSVVGPQNAGKTTLTVQMIRIWTQQGLHVAALKHDGHADVDVTDDWEKPRSDTTQFTHAGAGMTLIAGGGQSLLRMTRDGTAHDVMALCERMQQLAIQARRPLDVIAVEGFKRSELPKIVPVHRPSDVDWLRSEHLSNLRAVVLVEGLDTLADGGWPVYHESDVSRLCQELWDER